MKILMFGRGVISAQYGWAFEQAGHTVDFYVRPGRIATFGQVLPLNIFDMRKKISGVRVEEQWKINMREELPIDHDYDLIFVSVQHYHFSAVVDFLRTRSSDATILVFNNFWKEPLEEVAALPAGQVVWGFPMAAGGFDENGVLKGSLFPGVNMGTFGTALNSRDLAVRELFKQSGFKINEHKDFRSWLLIHFAMNAGMHQEVLKVGSISKMMSSSKHIKNVVLNVREMFPLLEARGVKPAGEASLFKLPPWLVSILMKAVLKLSYPLKYSLLSHSNPEELKAYGRDVLEEATRRNISMPRLEKAKRFFLS